MSSNVLNSNVLVFEKFEIEPNTLTPKIKALRLIPQYRQKSQEWIDQRANKLTASDFGTALGINPYETPESLLFKKCGLSRPYSNKATEHGNKYESEAINIYCGIMNKTNYEFGLVAYDQIPYRKETRMDQLAKILNMDLSFLAGSPDGIAVDNRMGSIPSPYNNIEEEVLLEVKCPLQRKIEYGYTPEYYRAQVQGNLFIFNLYKSDYIEYDPFKPIMNVVRGHSDENWQLENIPKLYDFWQEVLYWRSVGIKKHPKYEYYKAKLDADSENRSSFINDNTRDIPNEKVNVLYVPDFEMDSR
jgi:putative phage-type endonuclease